MNIIEKNSIPPHNIIYFHTHGHLRSYTRTIGQNILHKFFKIILKATTTAHRQQY